MRRSVLLLAWLVAAAGPPPADPDWPCVQRLVPELTAGTYWPGAGEHADWRSDPQVSELVDAVTPRSEPVEQGVKRLRAFASGVPAKDRASVLGRVFAGLVEETNAERGRVIERLRDMSRRQRAVTDTVARVTTEMQALPASAPADQRAEVANRRAFLIRDYDAMERTIRYACEAPVDLSARLGAFARALQDVGGG